MTVEFYDIIGDVHGQALMLEKLLSEMGYKKTNLVWRHPARKAIFVGDLIDRGPSQLRTLQIVKDMVEAGAALMVMGNHEWNAIAWHTRNPDGKGDYLRPRYCPVKGEKNRKQHAAYLAEVEHDPEAHRLLTEWYLTLPLWLDLPDIRVVHACWHPEYMEKLKPFLLEGNRFPRELLAKAMLPTSDGKDNELYTWVETILKGIDVKLPNNVVYLDSDKHPRDKVRTAWWDANAKTYQDIAMAPPAIKAQLPLCDIAPECRQVYKDEKPLFFGHYWMTGTPSLLSKNVVCVDYSAARGDKLCAYRWNGEKILSPYNFHYTK